MILEKFALQPWDMIPDSWKFNPFTPRISLVILLTVCHIVVMMSAWRIWYWINYWFPNWYFFLTLITCVLDVVLILWGEILSWSFMGDSRKEFESKLSTSFRAICWKSCKQKRIPQTLTLLGHKEVDTIFLEFLLEWIDKRTLSRDKQLSDHLSRKEYYHWIGYMWQQINLSIKVKTTALYNFPGGCSLLTLYTQT